jgi:hypothetical protein
MGGVGGGTEGSAAGRSPLYRPCSPIGLAVLVGVLASVFWSGIPARGGGPTIPDGGGRVLFPENPARARITFATSPLRSPRPLAQAILGTVPPDPPGGMAKWPR